MSRLSALILIMFLGCCGLTHAQEATASAIYDAVIIGAGAAGLAAAQALKAKGLSVIVLEGRNRVGGRCWTVDVTANGKTFPIDLGASWIHGINGNPLVPIAKSANVALSSKTTNYDNGLLYNEFGKLVSDANEAKYEATWESFEDFLENAQDADLDEDPGLQSTVNRFIAAKKLVGADLLAFKANLDTNFQHEYGAPISKLSLWFDEDSELSGGDKLVLGGYQKLVGSLASGITVRLDTTVTEISYSNTQVVVKTKSGTVYTGKTAVVTLPIGVLKAGTVKFSPPLPSKNANAIAAMGSGLLDKTVLVFPTAFWGTSIEFIDRIAAAGDGAWEEWLSLYPAASLPVLYGFNAATYAAGLEAKDDAKTVAEAMAILRKTWPNAPNPTTFKISRWNSDPFAKGSYSYTTPQMEYAPVHKDVASPLAGGRVQFAGEHTNSLYPATVHGAYYSGQTAACNILKVLGKSC